MRLDSSEFCSTCHKVHLDIPVNSYRWVRGFNSYDNWQASGVSGQGARSFYYPDQPQTCSDCHMPLVPSDDPGGRKGMIRSHRFATANTAVPFVNRDEKQLEEVRKFLQDGIISLDVFAVAPVVKDESSPQMVRRAAQLAAATGFAVGEEAGSRRGPVLLREVGNLGAPIDRVAPAVSPGETVRVDVVVRTRKVGHFFPSGTVDAFDIWVELEVQDASGKTVFWSGRVADDGKGPVDPGAHFYPGAPGGRPRQPDQQAQCLPHARIAVRATDTSRCGRRGALPRYGSKRCQGAADLAREAELPEVLPLLHLLLLRRRGRGRRPRATASMTGSSHSSQRTFREMSRVRSRTGFQTCRLIEIAFRSSAASSRPERIRVATDRGAFRLGTLERLRHRPAAARRPEGGGARLQAGHRGRSPASPTDG